MEIRCTRKKRARKNISKPFFGKNVDFTQYLPSFHIEIVIKMYEQAGAELGQAQAKLV